MRRFSAFALIVVAASSVAQVPTSPPGSPDPKAVTAGTYAVDSGHTLVLWTVDHLGFSPYTGIFGDVTGTLTIDPANPGGAKVDVTIPVSKVVTASAGLTAHLLRPGKPGGKPDFFGPSPANARFVSNEVAVTGQRAKVTGSFTLNGVTRPVTLNVSFYGAGKAPEQAGGKDNVGFRATGSIKRSEFGLGFGVPLVGDEVKLDIAAAFQKQ